MIFHMIASLMFLHSFFRHTDHMLFHVFARLLLLQCVPDYLNAENGRWTAHPSTTNLWVGCLLGSRMVPEPGSITLEHQSVCTINEGHFDKRPLRQRTVSAEISVGQKTVSTEDGARLFSSNADAWSEGQVSARKKHRYPWRYKCVNASIWKYDLLSHTKKIRNRLPGVRLWEE